jgi:hypothetical protein
MVSRNASKSFTKVDKVVSLPKGIIFEEYFIYIDVSLIFFVMNEF